MKKRFKRARSLRFSTEAYHESNNTVLACSYLSLTARTSISRKWSFLVFPYPLPPGTFAVRRVYTIVQRIKLAVLARAVEQVENANAAH
jgi:hypothetical protein